MPTKWWKLLFYCVLLSISVLTEILNPEVKQLFCTPLQIGQQIPENSSTRDK